MIRKHNFMEKIYKNCKNIINKSKLSNCDIFRKHVWLAVYVARRMDFRYRFNGGTILVMNVLIAVRNKSHEKLMQTQHVQITCK